MSGRPLHTFSIVAREAATGELGVAVQSHWFAVGAMVPWVEAGVGAVATQSFVDPSYGKLGLDLMRSGKSAPEALKALVAADATRMAGPGELVSYEGGREAALALEQTFVPVDHAIIAIVDGVNVT